MILDRLTMADACFDVHPGLRAGFEFLRRSDLAALAPGRHEIDGARLYATVIRDKGKGPDGARLETHRRYIDIQFSVAGCDRIGWAPASACTRGTGYAEEKDIEFFDDPIETWLYVPPGVFAVFFPRDAHAPMATAEDLHKVVVKIAADWDRA